jgi:hypothetical protein
MLRASFVCLPGIGEEAEQRLWRAGCLQWGQFEALGKSLFSKRKSQQLAEAIQEAEQALAWRRPDYFLYRLPSAHQGRVLGDFHKDIGYLDVETTGLSSRDVITTAVLCRPGGLHLYINGQNLFDLIEDLAKCQLLVTFNGTRFDLPFVKKALRMDLLIPHLDLMPVLRAMGHRGGLKAVEKRVGLKRALGDVNGGAAVDLWTRFREQGDMPSLRKLLDYNIEDARSLEHLLTYACKQSMSGFPIRPALPGTGIAFDTSATIDRFLSKCTLTSE